MSRGGGADPERRRLLRRLAAVALATLLAPLPGSLAWARRASGAAPEEAASRADGPAPGPVRVGVERCPYCSMSVIDARFAAQQVTGGGRVHVYDAIECLVDHLAGHGGPPLASGWCFVADFAGSTREQARLVSVHEAQLRHHPRLRTPMGGGLVAFASEDDADAFVAERGLRGAEAWSWDELVARSRERPWVPAR